MQLEDIGPITKKGGHELLAYYWEKEKDCCEQFSVLKLREYLEYEKKHIRSRPEYIINVFIISREVISCYIITPSSESLNKLHSLLYW